MYITFVSQETTGGSSLVVRYVWAAFPFDRYIKLGTAYGLYLLEIGQTVLVTGIAWRDLCAGWGNPSAFAQNNWGFSMTPLAGGLSK
jgi:hypothetical protein